MKELEYCKQKKCNICPFLDLDGECIYRIITEQQQESVEISESNLIRKVGDKLKEKFLGGFDSYAYVTYANIVDTIDDIVQEMLGDIK